MAENTETKLEPEGPEIEERLRKHSSHFASMVKLIPSNFYITRDDSEVEKDSKYWVNKGKSKAPMLAVKKSSKKAKKLKLDLEDPHSGEDSQKGGVVGGVVSTKELPPNGAIDSIINGFSVEHVRSTSLSDLQQRLKTKLEDLRGKRKVSASGGIGEVTEEEKARKRQKIMEKRKQKKELRERKKKVSKGTTSTTTNGQRPTRGSGEVTRPSIKDDQTGRIVYSKFDFSTSAQKEVERETGKDTTTKKKRDYQKLLARAEAAQKKLEELKKKDEKQGEELEKKLQWEKALDMARGIKVKDDPKLLRRTAKSLEKKKQKSAKEWEKRREMEAQTKEKQQEKRKRNLLERKEQIKAKKVKKRSKKGSGTRKPGF